MSIKWASCMLEKPVCHDEWYITICRYHGALTKYAKLRVAHAPGMPGTFFSQNKPRVSDPFMHHGTGVIHVPWCMPGSLTNGFLWRRWQEKRSPLSRRTSNPQFCVSGKRSIKSSLFLSWSMYNIINTQSYPVPWEGEPVKQYLSSWYPKKKTHKTHTHTNRERHEKTLILRKK